MARDGKERNYKADPFFGNNLQLPTRTDPRRKSEAYEAGTQRCHANPLLPHCIPRSSVTLVPVPRLRFTLRNALTFHVCPQACQRHPAPLCPFFWRRDDPATQSSDSASRIVAGDANTDPRLISPVTKPAVWLPQYVPDRHAMDDTTTPRGGAHHDFNSDRHFEQREHHAAAWLRGV